MSDRDAIEAEQWSEILTALTGETETDLRNLVLDAIVSVVSSNPDEKVDIWPVTMDVGRVANDGRKLIDIIDLPSAAAAPLNSL